MLSVLKPFIQFLCNLCFHSNLFESLESRLLARNVWLETSEASAPNTGSQSHFPESNARPQRTLKSFSLWTHVSIYGLISGLFRSDFLVVSLCCRERTRLVRKNVFFEKTFLLRVCSSNLEVLRNPKLFTR